MRHVVTAFVFLITTSIALAQTGSLLQWTSIASTSGNLRRVNVAVDRTFGQLLWDDGVGLYASSDGVEYRPLLDEDAKVLMRRNLVVAQPSGGPLLVAGTYTVNGDGVSACIVREDGRTSWLPDSLVRQVNGNGFRLAPRVFALTDSVYVMQTIISTDAGSTWTFVPDPEVGGLTGYTYDASIGLLARTEPSSTPSTWYVCRTTGPQRFTWQPFDLPGEYGLDSGARVDRLYLTKHGKALVTLLSIAGHSGLFSPFLYRDGHDAPWQVISAITASHGSTNDTLLLEGLQSAWTIRRDGDTRLFVAIDSGGVMLVDERGLTSTLINGGSTQWARRGLAHEMSFTQFIPAVYEDSIYVFDNDLEIRLRLPILNGFDAAQVTVGTRVSDSQIVPALWSYARTTNGLGWLYDPSQQQWVATTRLTTPAREFLSPLKMWSVIGATLDGSPGWMVHEAQGGLMQLSGSSRESQLQATSYRTVLRYATTTLKRFGLGERSYAAVGASVVRLTSDPQVLLVDTAVRLGLDTLTALTRTSTGRVLAAYQSIYERDSSVAWGQPGGTWRELLVRPQDDSVGAVSDLVAAGDTIVAGVRGFARTWQSQTVFRVWGGFLRSTDAGTTWVHINLPVDASSVEAVARTRSGALLAWAREAEIVGDTARNALLGSYEGSMWLLRSTDHGESWVPVLSYETFVQSSSQSTWRIVQRDDASGELYTVAGRYGLHRSTDDGLTWEAVDLSSVHEASVVDVASSRGSIMVVFEDALYQRASTTSVGVARGPEPEDMLLLVPTPTAQTAVLRWCGSERSFGNVRSCVMVNSLGEVVGDLTSYLQSHASALLSHGVHLDRTHLGSVPPGQYRLLLIVTTRDRPNGLRCSVPLVLIE